MDQQLDPRTAAEVIGGDLMQTYSVRVLPGGVPARLGWGVPGVAVQETQTEGEDMLVLAPVLEDDDRVICTDNFCRLKCAKQ